MADDMVLLTKTYDLLEWLLPNTEKFPKAYRFSVGRRLGDAALDFQEKLFLARKRRGPGRRALLLECDAHLDAIRHWQWLSTGQYEHASALVAELGRLLGGWLKHDASE